MDKQKTGQAANLIGALAESEVCTAFLRAGISCYAMAKDFGEDLIVEIGAYTSNPSERIEPRIGMLQIKGHDAESDMTTIPTRAKRRVEVEHLRRWAAHPMPIFLIAVDLVKGEPRFYAQSLDQILLEHARHGLAELSQETISISLGARDDLPDFVRVGITSFYEKSASRLTGLSPQAIERNHYEVISQSESHLLPNALARMRHFKILWKGTWRPAHFWACVNHLADHLQATEAGKLKALGATFHFYRSLRDCQDNNAVAHLSWIEEGHRDTDEIRAVRNWPKAKSWLRFKFNTDSELGAVPDLGKPVRDDAGFLRKAEVIWTELDAVLELLEANLSVDGRVSPALWETLNTRVVQLNDVEIEALGFCSPQYVVLDRFLTRYASDMMGVVKWLTDLPDKSEQTRRRWLMQDIVSAKGAHKAFRPLSEILSGK